MTYHLPRHSDPWHVSWQDPWLLQTHWDSVEPSSAGNNTDDSQSITADICNITNDEIKLQIIDI